MDVAITIVMLVPVLLAVALIINVIRKNVTERQAGDPVDISGAIPAVIVLMVAVLIIVAMGNAASPYVYDEESGELTIQKNVPQLDVQPWDSYASDVKSLIIQDGVTVATGAFDTMTGLEYVSVGEGSQIASGAFGVTFKDVFDSAMVLESGQYAGTGDGTLYQMDDGIFTYNSSKDTITGLGTDYAGAVNLVIPTKHDGSTTKAIGQYAFKDNTAIVRVLHLPDSQLAMAHLQAFYGCTSLAVCSFPDTVTEIRSECFRGCSTLAEFHFPASLTIIGPNSFRSTALTSVVLPNGLVEIRGLAFQSLTTIQEVILPGSLTSIATAAFAGCTGVTAVTFGDGFNATTSADSFAAWTFYASDGTTQINKSVAANLAGKTFQGTAVALVEVSDGQLSLTPDQLQQVRLHDAELQDLKDRLDIDPLPFQPSLQTEQEQVAA